MMNTGLPAARVTASVKRSSRVRSWSASRSSAAIASMLRAAGSGTAWLLSANAVRRQRPALAAQLVGDRRVAAERAHPRGECLRQWVPGLPVWNQRQSVGTRWPVFLMKLAGQQPVVPVKHPPEEPDLAVSAGNSLHDAEQYNSDAR